MTRLRAEGLVKDDPSDPDATMISPALLEILATARYEGVKLRGAEREPSRTFHVDRVIAEAKRLEAEDAEEQ